jgi:hypothetical protein
MEHHASAGWPTAVMASAGMWKTPDGAPYDLTAIAGADHWYSVGAQRVRALSNGLATFRRKIAISAPEFGIRAFVENCKVVRI